MRRRDAGLRAALWICTLALSVRAQGRPSEGDLFGGSQSGTPEPTATPSEPPGPRESGSVPTAPNGAAESRDAQILGATSAPMFSESPALSDPLTIGGQLYLRSQATASQGQDLARAAFSAPSLLDVYLDARPNERVRAFVLTRVSYDATLSSTTAAPSSALPVSGGSGAGEPSSLFQTQTRGPHLALDQLWLNFDVAHRVFVTAGTQHVRWGTGRFWAPTDYLHLTRRNPLDVFDARTGTAMVKLHVPVESKAWNFYGYALTESETASSTLNGIAGAARAELVLGPSELGLGVFARRQEKPRFAADLSLGVGDFDLYSELAVRDAGEIERVHYAPDAELPEVLASAAQSAVATGSSDLGSTVEAFYPRYRQQGYQPQLVAGLTYSQKYNDSDTFTLGAEYFYNSLGYGSPAPYPGLVLPRTTPLENPATFFYLGKVYGALFITFPAPFSLDNHSFTLSTLGNFSDYSFITRLNYGYTALTHLRFEAFAAAHYGHENGEFRFGTGRLQFGEFSFSRAPALLDVGLALRVSI